MKGGHRVNDDWSVTSRLGKGFDGWGRDLMVGEGIVVVRELPFPLVGSTTQLSP